MYFPRCYILTQVHPFFTKKFRSPFSCVRTPKQYILNKAEMEHRAFNFEGQGWQQYVTSWCWKPLFSQQYRVTFQM